LSSEKTDKASAEFIPADVCPLLNDPEFMFAVTCLSDELRDEPAELRAERAQPAPTNLDWQKLYSLLSGHRLSAHFYSLGLKRPGLWPDSFREQLRQDRYANLLYGDQCSLQVKQVLAALSASKIPVIVMKGWALISTLYGGDYGQRFCEDIDLLVQPDTADLAEAVLRDQGYVGLPEVSLGYTRTFVNCRRYYLAAQPPGAFRIFSIGLHWGLIHYPYFDARLINIPELFERARSLQVSGVNVLELSLEDQLVYICAHLALHHRNTETLANFFEIAYIIKRGGAQMDWQSVVDRAGAWRYGVQLKITLKQLNCLWPGLIPVPAFDLVQNLQTAWIDRWIDWIVERTRGNNFQSAVVELLCMPGLKAKCSAALRTVFPDKAYMQTRYGDSSSPGLLDLYVRRFMIGLRGIFQNSQN
jgi:hypothetical protein